MARVTGTREALPVPRESAADVFHENWWRHKTLAERNAYMLQHEIETDVTFVFRGQAIKNTMKSTGRRSMSTTGQENEDNFFDCPMAATDVSEPSTSSTNPEMNDTIQIGTDTSIQESSALKPIKVENPEDEDVQINAHKYVLSSASSVFWGMIGELHEKDELEIEDVDADTFRLMLRFIYTDATDVNNQTVIPLLNASKLYDLSTLTDLCSSWLANHVTPANACALLQKSLELKHERLALQCLKVIQGNTEEAFDSEGFSDISQDAFAYILNSETLSIKEVQVFHYCSVWATRKLMQSGGTLDGPNIRETLGPVLYKIRFPTLTMDDFTSIIVPTNVLSKEDELSIFRYLSMGAGSQCDVPFPTKWRVVPEPPKPDPPPPPPAQASGSRSGSGDRHTNHNSHAATSSSSSDPDQNSPKVIWSSKSSSSENTPLSAAKSFIFVSQADVGNIKVHQRVPPIEFDVSLCSETEAVLVCGMRLGAPMLDQTLTDAYAGDLDLPCISVINLTSHEPLLMQHQIEARHVKITDGFAYVDIKTKPFWLLEKEPIKVNIIYNTDERKNEDGSGNSGSIFKKMLNFASKAMKTNHYSCCIQIMPGSYSLVKGKEKRILIKGTNTSPIFGLEYEAT